MKVCFVDYADWDYNVDAPTIGPLGGSQSALCYLAMALAKAGHGVTVFTGTQKPGMVCGVECLHINSGTPEFFRERAIDAVVVLNSSGSSNLRAMLPSSTRLILWTQHEPVQPAMRKLGLPEFRDRWDGIVCVSDWQLNELAKAFDLKPERTKVLRNAIAPCFEKLFLDPEDMGRAKSNPLTLAYTSTPYRGLKHLPAIFPEIRKDNPKARLHVYSSMAVYQKHQEMEGVFADIYEALKGTDGVELIGSIAQPDLAQRLATSHILAYPNIFPETSCIAVMEAMAAGLAVVTSKFAALPETMEGFGDLVPIDFKNQSKFVRDYTEMLAAEALIGTHVDKLWNQVQHMNRDHTWSVRAGQWAEYLNAA
jgi:glycosyltransferase involved in cell wall biosynthesis